MLCPFHSQQRAKVNKQDGDSRKIRGLDKYIKIGWLLSQKNEFDNLSKNHLVTPSLQNLCSKNVHCSKVTHVFVEVDDPVIVTNLDNHTIVDTTPFWFLQIVPTRVNTDFSFFSVFFFPFLFFLFQNRRHVRFAEKTKVHVQFVKTRHSTGRQISRAMPTRQIRFSNICNSSFGWSRAKTIFPNCEITLIH